MTIFRSIFHNYSKLDLKFSNRKKIVVVFWFYWRPAEGFHFYWRVSKSLSGITNTLDGFLNPSSGNINPLRPKLKFKTRLKWLVPLKIVFNFWRFKLALKKNPVFGRFKPRLKFIKFGHLIWLSESLQWNCKPHGWIFQSLQWNVNPNA